MPRSSVRRWPIALVALSLVVVGAILWRAGVSTPEKTRSPRISGAVDLVAPDPLTEREQAEAKRGLNPDAPVRLEAGAWVEVADPATGKLAQRYSAANVEPLPDRWVNLREPRASFHSASGRIVTVRGDTAVAHIPRRELDAGTIQGNVIVKLFRPDSEGRIDLETDAPAVEVHTTKAELDGPLGQVRCDDVVEVFTPALRFKGRGLSSLVSERGDTPERVVVEEPLGPIRIDLTKLGSRGGTRPSVPAGADAQSAEGAPTASNSTAQASTARTDSRTDSRDASVSASPASGSAPTTPAPSSQTPTSQTPSTASPRAAPIDRFYRLTLHDAVRVVRMRNGQESTIEGTQLSMVFSMEGRSAREAFAALAAPQRPFGPMPSTTEPCSLALRVFTLSLAAAPNQEAEQDELKIFYTGRLVMEPTDAPGDQLASTEETRLEITGTPVVITDAAKELTGRCGLVRYDALPGRIELHGDATTPLAIDTPRFMLRGEHLWMVRESGNGRIEGPGVMAFAGDRSANSSDFGWWSSIALSANMPSDAVLPPGRSESLKEVSAVIASIFAAVPPAQQPANQPVSGPATQPVGVPTALEITWKDGVDLSFDPAADGGEGGSLREARFAGDVKVAGEDFAMGSQRLRVGFEPRTGSAAEDSIREIEAVGAVSVRRIATPGETGLMDAETMLLTMMTHEGKSIPKRLVATGGVVAQDATQTICAEGLTVDFKPRAAAEQAAKQAAAEPADGAAADGAESTGTAQPATTTASESMGNVEIESVLAERSVRVQLENGGRAYAERLEGDSGRGTLRLSGGEVVIVRDRVVADRMSEVAFDDATRSVHAPGAGRFRFFDTAPELPPVRTPERPVIAETPQLTATWTESMHYDDRGAPGGAIDLKGSVDVKARPAPDEDASLASQELRLNFSAPTSVPAATSTPGRRAGLEPGQTGGRDLSSLIATGSAVLESQHWLDAARSGEPPQLFQVRGDRVEYDLRTRESTVDGAGQVLIHDVTPAKTGLEGARSTFGSRGTSTIAWKGRMEMRREVEDRYTIVITDAVEVLHAGLSPEDKLTLTGDRLEVTLRRPLAGRAPGASGSSDATGSGGGTAQLFDLGGGAEVLRVRSIGRVFIRTAQQDVDCHEFDYNVTTGIAQLRARPGRLVQVVVKETLAPLRAESMTWDFLNGRIQIERAGGAVGR